MEQLETSANLTASRWAASKSASSCAHSATKPPSCSCWGKERRGRVYVLCLSLQIHFEMYTVCTIFRFYRNTYVHIIQYVMCIFGRDHLCWVRPPTHRSFLKVKWLPFLGVRHKKKIKQLDKNSDITQKRSCKLLMCLIHPIRCWKSVLTRDLLVKASKLVWFDVIGPKIDEWNSSKIIRNLWS